MKEENIYYIPMNTNKKYIGNKKISYKWYALFNVNGNDSYKEYRYIYENEIKENIEQLKEKSNSTRRCILSNIEKLSKVSNGLVVIDKDENNCVFYKIYNHIDDDYVMIPKDILNFLYGINSNIIKIYCLLLKLCNINDWTKIPNLYIEDYLGLSNSAKNRTTIKSCIENLVYYNLIDKSHIIDTSQTDINGKHLTKIYNQYKLKSYSDWKIFYNDFLCGKKQSKLQVEESYKKPKSKKSKKQKSTKLKNNPNTYYIVYLITDNTNGMKYIGKHKTKDLNDGYMGSGRLLKQNQEVKGIDKFTKEILHLCKNEEHMAEMERMEIEKVKAYENDKYYNLI